MADELISRSAILETLNSKSKEIDLYDVKRGFNWASYLVASAPTIEAEPRKHGHWILTLEDWNRWTCSVCGFTKRTDVQNSLGYDYCPACGAIMDEKICPIASDDEVSQPCVEGACDFACERMDEVGE